MVSEKLFFVVRCVRRWNSSVRAIGPTQRAHGQSAETVKIRFFPKPLCVWASFSTPLSKTKTHYGKDLKSQSPTDAEFPLLYPPPRTDLNSKISKTQQSAAELV